MITRTILLIFYKDIRRWGLLSAYYGLYQTDGWVQAGWVASIHCLTWSGGREDLHCGWRVFDGRNVNLRSDLQFSRHHTLFNRSRTRYASEPSRLKQRTKVDVGGLQFHGDDHGTFCFLDTWLCTSQALTCVMPAKHWSSPATNCKWPVCYSHPLPASTWPNFDCNRW